MHNTGINFYIKILSWYDSLPFAGCVPLCLRCDAPLTTPACASIHNIKGPRRKLNINGEMLNTAQRKEERWFRGEPRVLDRLSLSVRIYAKRKRDACRCRASYQYTWLNMDAEDGQADGGGAGRGAKTARRTFVAPHTHYHTHTGTIYAHAYRDVDWF